MFKFIGRVINALKNRQFDSIKELKEDLRKVGIVFFGSGLLAVVLNFNYLGIVPAAIGFLLMYLGLTSGSEPDKGE
ncbi:hypothetical protein [Methylophaga nitratireducenticrescens]|uniref:hypothetical protein n=1 Tax=Methylophaga nitratireducenticrescens TaxID=754476 RepID=UPI000CDBA7A5|nr:hypothetical protein [Methylophaga nitratireducenticrescens]AUZ86165.1 hypothetical protein CDW43_16045 [Methylophaga nitratireducenticrescens]